MNDDVALLDEQIPDVDQTSMETPQEQNGESDRNAGMPDLVHDNDPEPPNTIAGKDWCLSIVCLGVNFA